MLRTLTLFLSAANLILAGDAVNQLSDDEKLAGWQLLFDGETTTGWEGFNDTPLPQPIVGHRERFDPHFGRPQRRRSCQRRSVREL